MQFSLPQFSLVIPLHDDRGVALQILKAWLSQRTLDNHFEIILVNPGRNRFARKAAQLIGPSDCIVQARTSNEATLYNSGAGVAASDWIVFSESHVAPAPVAVSNLCKRLKSTSGDAAALGSGHRIRSRFSRVDAALCDYESAAMRDLGLWRSVGLRGFAIRRNVFNHLGMFTEAYFRFAETVLAIRIVEAGFQLEQFHDVLYFHGSASRLCLLRADCLIHDSSA